MWLDKETVLCTWTLLANKGRGTNGGRKQNQSHIYPEVSIYMVLSWALYIYCNSITPTCYQSTVCTQCFERPKLKASGVWSKEKFIDDHRHLGTSRDPRKIVLYLLTLVNVNLVTRFLQIFSKQHILPLSPQERHFLVRGCFFNKIQAGSRIPLMISMSIHRMNQKLLAWGPWEQNRLEQDEVREGEHFTLLQTLIQYYYYHFNSESTKAQSS